MCSSEECNCVRAQCIVARGGAFGMTFLFAQYHSSILPNLLPSLKLLQLWANIRF